jgi:hypothetical protein
MNISDLRRERDKLNKVIEEMIATVEGMDRTLLYFEEQHHHQNGSKPKAAKKKQGKRNPETEMPRGDWNRLIGEAYKAGKKAPPEMWAYIQQHGGLSDDRKQAFYAARNAAKKKGVIPDESYLIGKKK